MSQVLSIGPQLSGADTVHPSHGASPGRWFMAEQKGISPFQRLRSPRGSPDSNAFTWFHSKFNERFSLLTYNDPFLGHRYASDGVGYGVKEAITASHPAGLLLAWTLPLQKGARPQECHLLTLTNLLTSTSIHVKSTSGDCLGSGCKAYCIVNTYTPEKESLI